MPTLTKPQAKQGNSQMEKLAADEIIIAGLPVASNGAHDATELEILIQRVKQAQAKFAQFTQEQVDAIFRAAAMAANAARIPLARQAVEETGMGVIEDKIIKNHFAAEFIYNKYRDEKTCGVLVDDRTNGITRIAEPLGVLAGIVPTTNPTSTAIFKALIALKTRNAIVFAPHPRAKRCTVEAARIVRDAAIAAGAPHDIVAWISEPTVELSGQLMKHPDIALILATGGPGMVKAAYSSGNPAIGVGAGNTPAVIDETADIELAVNSILLSKTFDNGMICASEQTIVAVKAVADRIKAELTLRGAHLCTPDQRRKLGAFMIQDGKLNGAVVGQTACRIAELAGFTVPATTKVLIGEASVVGKDEPFAYEKLSPILGFYEAADYNAAVDLARQLVNFGGLGHTAALYTASSNVQRIKAFSDQVKAGRILVNTPSSHGAIGDLYNFRLEPSLTLGCGSWGGNSVSENVGVKHLLNIKTIADRRENMLWFQVPAKLYHKFGCLSLALHDLADKKRAFIVTDKPLFDLKYTDRVTSVLNEMGIAWQVFSDVEPDPTFATVHKGVAVMNAFQPDVIISLGGGSPMDAAKIMRVLYEYPEVDFADLAMRFMDIRKRVYAFPKLGIKASMVAIPTTSGTGSEVTPFAVVTDEKTGQKYPIADYALTPDMAIVDPELVMTMPKGLTAFSGIDALTHALEAIASVLATEYTNAMALEAIRLLFKYLPAAYHNGTTDVKARSKVHNAATMAGMAFANGFLGICHSMAHKMGAEFHLPHGLANALLINHVIKFNASDAPVKMAAFSQYSHPDAKQRYARVADYLQLGGKTADEKVDLLIAAITNLKQELNIPASIEAAGVKREAFMNGLEELTLRAFDDQCTGANPRYPLLSEMKQLYMDAFEGRITVF